MLPHTRPVLLDRTMHSPRCIAGMVPNSAGAILKVFDVTWAMLLNMPMKGRSGPTDVLPSVVQVPMDMMPRTVQPVCDSWLTKQGCQAQNPDH